MVESILDVSMLQPNNPDQTAACYAQLDLRLLEKLSTFAAGLV